MLAIISLTQRDMTLRPWQCSKIVMYPHICNMFLEHFSFRYNFKHSSFKTFFQKQELPLTKMSIISDSKSWHRNYCLFKCSVHNFASGFPTETEFLNVKTLHTKNGTHQGKDHKNRSQKIVLEVTYIFVWGHLWKDMLKFQPKKYVFPLHRQYHPISPFCFINLFRVCNCMRTVCTISTLSVKVGQYTLTLCLGEKILAFCPCWKKMKYREQKMLILKDLALNVTQAGSTPSLFLEMKAPWNLVAA